MLSVKITSILALASTGAAHFFLQNPETIGFDDSKMEEGPCGGFDPTLRNGPVTDWPVNGHPVSLITTHQDVVWHVEAALLSDPTNFVPIVLPFRQTGVGEVCFETIPGKASWIGEQVVISIYQVTNHGDLYQCVAARFMPGPAAEVPSACVNFDGVEHEPIVAAPDDETSTTSSSPPTAITTTSVPSTVISTTSTPPTVISTSAVTTAHSSDEDHSHGSASATSASEHDHEGSGHSTAPTPSATGGHGHGDGEHSHGDDESPTTITVSPTNNGTIPEPTHAEAGAGKMAVVGAAYALVCAAVLAVY